MAWAVAEIDGGAFAGWMQRFGWTAGIIHRRRRRWGEPVCLARPPALFDCRDVKDQGCGGVFYRPCASGKGVYSVSIPGEDATLSADETAEAARGAGLSAVAAAGVQGAIDDIISGGCACADCDLWVALFGGRSFV